MLTELPKPKPLAPRNVHLEAYANAVWEAHCLRRLSDFPLMSSVEFSLVLSWYEAGIPLRIVLRGMQDTKARAPRLRYYEPSVAEAVAYWRRTVA